MKKMSLSIIVFIITVLLSTSAIAQTTGGGFTFTPQFNFMTNPQNLQPPATVPSPLDFPQPIIIPQGNVNNFELSTLTQSTIGMRTKQLSNLEINQPGEKKQLGETTVERVFPEEPGGIAYLSLPPSTSKKFYKWVDENGVFHVTNKPDSIPPKYRKE